LANALAKDIAQSLAEPDLREWFVEHGAEPMSSTQPEFARFMLSERDRAARIMSGARAKPR
jgi:tripartite-type tricarboxylate transporter receptor subunit TctC